VIAIDITGSVPRFPKRDIVTFARRVLRQLRTDAEDLAIAFVDDAAMRKLNREFRRKDKTTDVLTFPGDEPTHLGDIVISLEQARVRLAMRSIRSPSKCATSSSTGSFTRSATTTRRTKAR
jgi:ssRNA-specific RNase YbeY (16S rRNA maturation enzyme)